MMRATLRLIIFVARWIIVFISIIIINFILMIVIAFTIKLIVAVDTTIPAVWEGFSKLRVTITLMIMIDVFICNPVPFAVADAMQCCVIHAHTVVSEPSINSISDGLERVTIRCYHISSIGSTTVVCAEMF